MAALVVIAAGVPIHGGFGLELAGCWPPPPPWRSWRPSLELRVVGRFAASWRRFFLPSAISGA